MNILRRIYNYIFAFDPNFVSCYVEQHSGYSMKELRGPKKGKEISKARRKLIIQLNRYTAMSAKDIAKYVNRSTQYVYFILNK